jgi:hypothetical protein
MKRAATAMKRPSRCEGDVHPFELAAGGHVNSSGASQPAEVEHSSGASQPAEVTRQPCANLGSVVQALRCNSSSTLLGVRNGSDWSFELNHDIDGDVMNQEPQPLVSTENRIVGQRCRQTLGNVGRTRVDFDNVGERGNRLSIALLEAMQTNKTVRSFDLCVDRLGEQHLTAIVDSLLENDTLQSLSICASTAITCSIAVIRAAFLRIMDRNVCLQELSISLIVFEEEDTSEDTDPAWEVDLGAPTTAAISRNCEAFALAQALGQVSRISTHCYPHIEDIGFRHQLLSFFLPQGCNPPPIMLYIAKGLPNH